MELEDLGFDEWFRSKLEEAAGAGGGVARITRVDRDRYLVRNEHRELSAEASGKLLYYTGDPQDLPCVGDWALVQYVNDGTHAIVQELLPRRTFLRRKTAGLKVEHQIIAANVDAAFIVQACGLDYNLRRMERYIVMAKDGHVEPIVLLNKSDLAGSGELATMTAEIGAMHPGVRVAAVSALHADELDGMRRLMEKGKTYCLLGSSGVGKTTILNQLLGRDAYETGPVRESDERGRHTTSYRYLSVLDAGSLLIDTPGMRELGMLADSASIDDTFEDIAELSQKCRFTDCSHAGEAGCAIAAALASGELDEARYQSYLKLAKEAAFHQMSYLERRRKDRAFGRMVKTVLKNKKR